VVQSSQVLVIHENPGDFAALSVAQGMIRNESFITHSSE